MSKMKYCPYCGEELPGEEYNYSDWDDGWNGEVDESTTSHILEPLQKLRAIVDGIEVKNLSSIATNNDGVCWVYMGENYSSYMRFSFGTQAVVDGIREYRFSSEWELREETSLMWISVEEWKKTLK